MADTMQTNPIEATLQLLQRDLASVDIPLAVYIIEQWEHQLQGTDLFEDLLALKQAILNGNQTEVTTLLHKVSEHTLATAQSQKDTDPEVAAKVEQIGQLLSQSSNN